MVNSNNHGRYKLTVKQIDAATLQPEQKIRKLADGAGLTLTLRHGADGIKRYWHLRYADPINKKEQTASLCTYPDTGLAKARENAKTIKEGLENHVYSTIGEIPIKEVTASDVRAIMRKIARAGAWETAQPALQRIHTVFVWAEDEELEQNGKDICGRSPSENQSPAP